MVHKGLWCLAFSNFFTQKSNRVVASGQRNFSAKEKTKNSFVKQKWLRPKKSVFAGTSFRRFSGAGEWGMGVKRSKSINLSYFNHVCSPNLPDSPPPPPPHNYGWESSSGYMPLRVFFIRNWAIRNYKAKKLRNV